MYASDGGFVLLPRVPRVRIFVFSRRQRSSGVSLKAERAQNVLHGEKESKDPDKTNVRLSQQ